MSPSLPPLPLQSLLTYIDTLIYSTPPPPPSTTTSIFSLFQSKQPPLSSRLISENSTTILTTLALTSLLQIHRKGTLRHFKTAEHVPVRWIEKKKWIKGRVIHVNDGDGIRILHTTALRGWKVAPWKKGELGEQTINIRLAGVDAPEGGYFGKTAQPFSKEAKLWLDKALAGKVVHVQMLKRDQYQRIVGMVYKESFISPPLPFFNWQNISIQLVRAGYACVYDATGAVYGHIEKILLKEEKRARFRRRKIGMWVLGDKWVHPAKWKAA